MICKKKTMNGCSQSVLSDFNVWILVISGIGQIIQSLKYIWYLAFISPNSHLTTGSRIISCLSMWLCSPNSGKKLSKQVGNLFR